MNPFPKHLKRNILFSLIPLFVLLFGVEGGARLFFPYAPLKSPLIVPDDTLNHRLIPNSSDKIIDTGDFSYRFITNRQGWQEKYDITLEKPDNVFRIFFVGDSTVAGRVAFGNKMVDIVEKRLNERVQDQDIRFEVINTGTMSYSTILYYLLIKTDLINYSPDLIVLCIDMTDVPNDAYYKELALYDDEGNLKAVLPSSVSDKRKYRLGPFGRVELTPIEQLRHRLLGWSVVMRYIDDYFGRLGHKKRVSLAGGKFIDSWVGKEWSEKTRADVRYSMHLLELTIALLQEKGINFYVTGVPAYLQFNGYWSSKPHRILREITENQNGIFLDSFEALLPVIAKSKIGDYYFNDDPTHFNIRGNSVWADTHLKFLLNRRNKFLPENVY